VKVIACIEDPVVIRKILDHLKDKAASAQPTPLPRSRAPPVCVWTRTGRPVGLFG
jgi:hypothetical protein